MSQPFLYRQFVVFLLLFFLCDSLVEARSWQQRSPAPRVYQPTCQTTRGESMVMYLHEQNLAIGNGLDRSYTGRGVLLGVIDVGIEFNHLNFRKPETGETRLRAAVLYRPEEGAPDSVREYYVDPFLLDTLTTDTPFNAHGTHTAGVAAGSYPHLGQQGMAPEADLMLCGTSSLTDERIIDAMKLIFGRADELDVPCVINLSIGNPVDWKDGRTPFCLACDSLTEGGNAPGRIIVASSGNDGEKRFAFDCTFSDSNPLYALLQPMNYKGKTAYFNPNIDVYCSDSLPLALDYVLFDTLRHTFSDCSFEQHLLDTLEAGHDGNRHLCIDADTCWMESYPNCLLAARVQGQKGSSMTAYYINDMGVEYRVLDGPDERWLKGTSYHSISDLCCTDAVLSVGAYSAVDSVVNIFGQRSSALAPRGQICGFSSYGTTAFGDQKPDVVCPGASVVSSFSSYWKDKIEYYYTSGRYLNSPMMYVFTPEEGDAPWYRSDDPQRAYYWIHSVGTSQSAPVMSGIIALWLEACPTLSVRDVRDILQHTSRFDNYCLAAPGGVMQAGNGKADALAGIREVLSRTQGIVPIDIDRAEAVPFYYDLMGRRVSANQQSNTIILRQK